MKNGGKILFLANFSLLAVYFVFFTIRDLIVIYGSNTAVNIATSAFYLIISFPLLSAYVTWRVMRNNDFGEMKTLIAIATPIAASMVGFLLLVVSMTKLHLMLGGIL